MIDCSPLPSPLPKGERGQSRNLASSKLARQVRVIPGGELRRIPAEGQEDIGFARPIGGPIFPGLPRSSILPRPAKSVADEFPFSEMLPQLLSSAPCVRRAIGLATAFGCALTFSGCQLLSLGDVQPAAEPAAANSADLRKLLSAGKWELDRNWSLLESTSEPRDADSWDAIEPWRWKFAISTPPKKKEASPPDSGASVDIGELQKKYTPLFDEHPKIAGEEDRNRWFEMRRELEVAAQSDDETALKAAVLLSRCHSNPSKWLYLDDKQRLVSGQNEFQTVNDRLAQAAAMEVYCRRLAPAPGDAEDNFAPAGRLLEEKNFPEEVRDELFRGIARRIPPRQIPGLNAVMVECESEKLASPPHLAAMEACVIHAWHRRGAEGEQPYEADLWPDGLNGCRFSDDVMLRKLYGRWAVLANHPEAFAVVKSQRMDTDLGVRKAAVVSLGLLDAESTHEELLAVMANGTEPERVAAIACLARSGIEEIFRFARDDSPRVRAAVATQLRKFPSPSAALALSELLSDRTFEVQLAALNAAAAPEWKDSGGVSLCLQALRVGVLNTRKAAISQLRSEWGREPMFPLEGTAEERDAAVRELAQEHGVSAEVFTTFAGTETPATTSGSDLVGQETVRRMVREFLSHGSDGAGSPRLLAAAESLNVASAIVIEQELQRASGPRADQVFREVLPRCHPGYAALEALDDTDAAARRQAAHQLQVLAERGSLSPTLLKRLSRKMTFEQDRQVWQEVLTAILPDALPEAAQLALVSLNSAWPDIRQLGCDYFERHPQPEYTPWLLPRLQDADRQIRLRTIRILAQCGNPVALDGFPEDADAAGLRQFLTQPDPQFRWEAVVAMTRLGDAQAAQELIRQTYDPQPRQREAAIVAIGATGQSRLVEPLLRRLWTESDGGVQAALLKSLDQLTPMDERPGLAVGTPIGDKIKEWARWWEQQQRNRSATAGSQEVPAGRTVNRASNRDGTGHDGRF